MLVYIKPLSMFPELHSDRLFGAILSAINEIFPDKHYLDDIKRDFNDNNPPFLISSAFPSVNVDGNHIRFFPKLILNKKSDKTFHPDVLKDFKKVKYFEEKIFSDMVSGKLSEDDLLENYHEDYKRINGMLMAKNRDINVHVKNVIRPGNAINRLNNKTEIFYHEGIMYGENFELFFFVEFYNNDYENVIKSALKFLRDRGFGKDIFNGKGHFNYEIEDVNANDLLNHEDGDMFMTLSRFIPDIDRDVGNIDDSACYDLGVKRSRDKMGEVRKQVRFFKEGSTFRKYGKHYGCIVESGEKYPAIEFGYAFPISYTQGD